MNEITIIRKVFVGMLLLLALVCGGTAMAQTGNLAKIDPVLQERMQRSRDANETFRVIIEMTEQYNNSDLEHVTALMTRAQRRDYVVNELKLFSESSQAEVSRYLQGKATSGRIRVIHNFWIFNGLCCEMTADCIGELSTRQDVQYISLDKVMQLDELEEEVVNRDNNPPEGVQWHVAQVHADSVWNYHGTSGYTGNGVVVAIIDSGVNYEHDDIEGNMWNGNQNHGWDFYNDGDDPMDYYGHGTHVAGIVAGHGSVYQTGVAPGATIMALKVGGDQSKEHPAQPFIDLVIAAVQFAVEHGADILNLSIGIDGGGIAEFRDVFVNVLNAGVVATVGAGNNGNEFAENGVDLLFPVPYNVQAPGNCPPPWHNPTQPLTQEGDGTAVICVGATNKNSMRALYSSIGPVTWAEGQYIGDDYNDYPYEEGSSVNTGLIRPDVVAPGGEYYPGVSQVTDMILSLSFTGNSGYRWDFGTSMAAPCVAGVIALMLEANPNLTPAQIDEILETTAVPCGNQIGKNYEYGAGRVDAYAAVTAAINLIGYSVTTTAFPTVGGITTGGGFFHAGDQCTVTANPNPGFAFMGWYNNALGSILYSRQPEYTFTVTHDRNLVAKFVPGSYTVTTSCSPSNGGTISGNQGTYTVGNTVTLTATANTGYAFSCWTEDGQVLSNQPTYSFQICSDRHLVANFMNLSFSIGDVITNPDGSKGVVFYINPTYTGGCMVALEDVSTGCQWGNSGDIPFLRNYARTKHEERMSDLDGYANTTILRDYQAANANYASGKVDYDHGWYVPSAGQLRKIFSALPFIENAITNAGGTKLVNNASYWSSTERSETNAWMVGATLEVLNTSKTSNCRLRAVHDFSINNTMRIDVGTNDVALGSAVGSGFYNNGATVTVTATPTGDNLFRGWTEAGHLVSQDPIYTFSANSNRKLVANFAIRGGIGTLVTNPDGSQGILFHLNEDGSEGWMVALEDASVGCQWGPSSDISIIQDRSINNQRAIEDQSGYHNTQRIRLSQGTNNNYAASIVDFENGWYLPSSGQLRKLYATLPIIEEAIVRAGGSMMTGDKYWSSTEYSPDYASTPGFAISNTYKTSNCRIRAIRNYYPAGDYGVFVAPNNENYGSVSGSGTFALNQTVTVTATPNEGYQFDHWTEDGAIVSYDAVYQFPFTRSRSLVAHFVVPGTVGSVITNVDGSRGVVFYTDLSGNSLMVALEDVSSGCAWGANQDITTLENLNPSQTQNMLNDMNGYANTQTIRNWQSNNSNYAAGKVDFANKWYLPSAGEMRKLYAALPLIEEAIVSAGGSVMTGDSYWSSSENSSSQAWSPSFEFTKAYKTNNLRVRAIRRIVPQMMIAATANPEEGGTVSGAGAYDSGATCTLTATPNEHFAFVNWTENGVVVSTNATYSFTVTGNRTLVANFELNTYNVVIFINPSEGGMVTGAGTYNYGETCTLVATANEGYTFINWTKNGQSVSTNLVYSFTVTENVDFVANFTPNTYEITATATPTDGGIVTGTGVYNYGSTCTLTATENIGYHFVNWMLGGVVVSNTQTYTFTVTEAADYTANFELNTYEITATANPTGGGTVTGAGTYNHGATATLAATANTGYTFVNWTKDGQQVSTSASYSFTVTGSGAYIANFEPDICIVTVTANPSEGGTVTGSGTYDYGTQVTLTATASEGYTFVNWTANGALLSTSPTCTFTVTGDTDCVARFLSGDGIVQIGSFTSGWNWWNTYIEQGGMDGLQMLEDGLGSNGIQIKSQQQYVNDYEGMGWMGMLASINNESTYKIKTSAPCTVEMTGLETIASTHPITITPGWNWIGYPVNASMSVTTAMSGITPTNGDQVKAQNGYANYYEGMGWMGTLMTIEPSMGLLYKSNGGTNFTLVYPEGAKGETLKKNITAEGNHWIPDMTAYPNNMTVTAVVELDDVELASDNYEIGVFANGECRGSARLMYVEPLNRYMAFLTITGEDVVDLNFGLYNTMTGEVETCQGASLWYETNAIVGSVLEPYVIRFRGTMGMDEWATSVDVFPNPVTSGEIIHISLPMVETLHASSVQIVNALGQVVETRRATSLQTIVAPSVAGVYTLRITVEGKETCYRKLIVR